MSPKMPPKITPKVQPKIAPKAASKPVAKASQKATPKSSAKPRSSSADADPDAPKSEPAADLENTTGGVSGSLTENDPDDAGDAEVDEDEDGEDAEDELHEEAHAEKKPSIPVKPRPIKIPPPVPPKAPPAPGADIPHHRKMVMLAKGIAKVHGQGALQVTPKITRQCYISTRSIALDLQLGGGIAVGRVACLVGEASGGKTSIAIDTLAEAQTLCANCYRPVWDRTLMMEVVRDQETGRDEEIYWQEGFCDCVKTGLVVPKFLPGEKPEAFAARKEKLTINSYRECRVAVLDVEGTFSMDWAMAKGLDPRLVAYSRPVSAEEAIDIFTGLIESGLYDLILLDSVAELTPSKEIEDSAEDQHRALASKLINRAARVTQANINKSNRAHDVQVTAIWIQQWRMKMNAGLWEDPRVMPGGKGQDYLYSQIIDVSSKAEKAEQAQGATKESGFRRSDMTHIRFAIRKNKLGAAAGGGSFDMWTAGPLKGKIDDSALLLAQAKALNVIMSDGGKWSVLGQKFKTQKDMIEWLYDSSDPSRLWSVRQEMINAFHPSPEIELSSPSDGALSETDHD